MLKTVLLYTAVAMVLAFTTYAARRGQPTRIRQRSGLQRRITPDDCQ